MPLWRPPAVRATSRPAVRRGAHDATPARWRKKNEGETPCHGRSLRGIAVALPALAALLLCGRGRAEDYPTRPITIIVSLAAGTGMDTAVRLYGEQTVAAPRPARRDRKSAGRRRRRRRRDHRQGRRRRLHARGRDQRRHGDPADAVQAAAVRSAHRLRADLALREIAVRVHRQPVAAGPLRPRVHQIRQGAPGPTQLQLLRHRRSAPSDRGVAETEVRVRHGPRAVSKQSAIDRRRRRRPRGRIGRRGRRIVAADQGREVARACGHLGDALPHAAGRSADRRRRSECRTWRRCPGM